MSFKKVTSIFFLGILFIISGWKPATAQFSNIGDLVEAGEEDLQTLTQAYLKPLPSGLGSNINSGWSMQAKPHSTLGFDVQLRGALALIPETDQEFDLDDLDLNNIRPDDPNETLSPTIGGADADGPVVVLEDDQGNEVQDFTLPGGTGFNFVPSPMVQASVGVIKDTEVTARYVPTVNQSGVSFGMRGFGIKHGINQWIPASAVLPVDISVMAGFTNVDISSELDVQPDPGSTPRDPADADKDFENQEATIGINNFSIQALVGKSLPIISAYGGVGYETSTSNAELGGNYPVNNEATNQYEVISDPVNYSEDGGNSMSLLAGAKVKFLFFNVFAEYKLANYSTASAGVAFSFR